MKSANPKICAAPPRQRNILPTRLTHVTRRHKIKIFSSNLCKQAGRKQPCTRDITPLHVAKGRRITGVCFIHDGLSGFGSVGRVSLPFRKLIQPVLRGSVGDICFVALGSIALSLGESRSTVTLT